LRARLLLASTLALTFLALTHPAWAGPTQTYYLHDSFILDERVPSQAAAQVLRLSGSQFYSWNSTAFSADQTFPAGTWVATIWMNITSGPTQFRVRLGANNQSGSFLSLSYAYTTSIVLSSATAYQVVMTVSAFKINAGGYLSIGLERRAQSGQYSLAAFVFFDSPGAPSSLTTTIESVPVQNLGVGFAFAVIGIGAGGAAAAVGFAVAMSGSQVYTYGGYYYCRKHRVPVWSYSGCLWCPVERRYLRP
jgi:hypothetical protein